MSIQGRDRPDLLRTETLADILEATAARQPDALALRDATTALSDAKLPAAADRVAHHLLTDPQPSPGPGRLWKHATKRWAWD